MLFFKKKYRPLQLPAAVSAAAASQGERDELDRSCFQKLQTSLRLQQDRLQKLSGSTEDEFLGIGARLQEFYTRTVEIGTASVAVTDQVGGEEIQANIRELGDIIDRMDHFLIHLKAEAELSSISLRETLLMIARVDEPLAGFKKIMKVLHVLGTSTKIESARLGLLGASFHNVADDVENLAVQINDKSARIMAENVSLSGKIKQTLARMNEIEAAQNEDVSLVLDRTRTSLEMITGVHRKCAEVAAAIAASSNEVSRNIYEIVTSMQFHDITRQQLEHVQEALCSLESRLAAQAGSEVTCFASSTSGEMAGEVYGVCQLQAAQLLHARDLLTKAVSGIVVNLTGLADKGRGIALQTRGMIGVADGAGDSFFVEIEKSLRPVIELLIKSTAANRNMAGAVGSVAATVGEIAIFVNDIEMIGEEIKLIALNSQVKAALTGDEGAALGVLAEAIQRLSIDACAQTAAVTDTLHEITRVTEDLLAGVSVETGSAEMDIEAMAGRLKRLIESIRAMNDSVMATLAQSDASVQALSSDIDSATVGITVHHEVSAEVISIAAELERITEQARESAPEAAATDLAALSGRYTMQSERQIHASVTGAAAVLLTESAGQSRQAPAALVTGEEDSALGDNVEFF